jgi:hypothetical protein
MSGLLFGTVLPTSTTTSGSAKDNERLALNTAIRANAVTYGYSVADYAADATMGAYASTSNTALYVDGVHPSKTAYVTYLGPIFAAAVNTLA